MEINITCLFHLIIISILFLHLSYFLFIPMNQILMARKNKTVDKLDKIDNINKQINKQRNYISEQINKVTESVQTDYNKNKEICSITYKDNIRVVQNKFQKDYVKSLAKLKLEENITYLELNKAKENLVMMICRNIHKN